MILQARALFQPGYNVTPPGGGAIVRLFPGCAADNLAAAARIAEEGPSHFRTMLQSGGELIPFLWTPICPDSLFYGLAFLAFLWAKISKDSPLFLWRPKRPISAGRSLGPPISPDCLSLVNPSLIHQKAPLSSPGL